jgi:hypothetical protein
VRWGIQLLFLKIFLYNHLSLVGGISQSMAAVGFCDMLLCFRTIAFQVLWLRKMIYLKDPSGSHLNSFKLCVWTQGRFICIGFCISQNGIKVKACWKLSVSFPILQFYTLSHSTSPFCDGLFWDRVSWTICLGWLWTAILLISASWVDRITDVSHQCLVKSVF